MTTMNQALLAAALLALSGAAAAEWTPVGGNEQTTFYADLASLQAADGKARLWTMVSSAQPRKANGASYSSIRTQFEFDCAAQRVRGLQTRFHAGTLAEGEVVGSIDEAEEWEALVPGTVKDALAKVACDK